MNEKGQYDSWLSDRGRTSESRCGSYSTLLMCASFERSQTSCPPRSSRKSSAWELRSRRSERSYRRLGSLIDESVGLLIRFSLLLRGLLLFFRWSESSFGSVSTFLRRKE